MVCIIIYIICLFVLFRKNKNVIELSDARHVSSAVCQVRFHWINCHTLF